MNTLRRTIHPEVRVLDAKAGLVEYIASDETCDSYREIIRANGWRFDHFQKNAPFVDSHDYSSFDKQVGRVIEFAVKGKRLVETVKWAVDVMENKLAQLGWKMTEAGYLKAVSVGFFPVKQVTRFDSNPAGYQQQLQELKFADLPDDQKPRTIYLEQQQLELSACIIGANPNALAKSFKAGVLSEPDMEFLAARCERRPVLERACAETAPATIESALVAWADARTAQAFLDRVEQINRRI